MRGRQAYDQILGIPLADMVDEAGAPYVLRGHKIDPNLRTGDTLHFPSGGKPQRFLVVSVRRWDEMG